MRLRHPDGQTVYLAGTLPTHSEHEVRGVFTRLPPVRPSGAAASDRPSEPSDAPSEPSDAPSEPSDPPSLPSASYADVSCLSLVINPSFASALAGSIGMRRRLQYGLASRG